MMPQLRIGPLTIQWLDEGLLVTTPTGQYQLDAKQTCDLFLYLYHLQDSIMYGDVPEGVPMIGPTDSSPELSRCRCEDERP
jgi:hypothetical protein